MHNLYSIDCDHIQFGIFDCKTSVYIFLFIGNFYFLLLVSIFIIGKFIIYLIYY